MTDKSINIKKRIKQAIRENPGLSQKVVAGRLDITESYLSQLLDGKREGSYDLILSIADAAGVKIHDGTQPDMSNVEMENGGALDLEKMIYQLIKDVGILTNNCNQVKDMLTNIESDVITLKKAVGPQLARHTRRSEVG